jgi:hypothetical protein
VIGRYCDLPEEYPGVAHFHTKDYQSVNAFSLTAGGGAYSSANRFILVDQSNEAILAGAAGVRLPARSGYSRRR